MMVDWEMADRMMARCDNLLREAEPDIPNFAKQENWRAVSGLVKGACRDALQLGMIKIRRDNDIDLAQEYFLRARNLSMVLMSVPAAAVTASSFEMPLYCCLLSGDIDSAQQLAEVAVSGEIKLVSGSHFDVHAQILSSFILDDHDAFRESLLDFEKLETIYWWEKQRVYFRLYRAVLDSDQVCFNELLLEANELFKGRRTDVDFGNQLGEYGGLEYNDFAIDFMSVSIAVVARSKGLRTMLHNDYFPSELVR